MGINVAFPEVGQRQVYAARQMGQEVAQGVKSGAIDSNELGGLKTTAQGNLQNVKGYASDGQITGQEQKAIAQQQVALAKDIFEYKNNTAPAGSAPPPAPAAAPQPSTATSSPSATAAASTGGTTSTGAPGESAPAPEPGAPEAPAETPVETETSASTGTETTSGSSSQAPTGFSVAYPELGQRQVFAARQMLQEVVQGVKSGSIDGNELGALKSTAQGNVSALKGYASDGAISGQEQKAIAQGQAEMARAIYQATYSSPA